MPSKNQKQQKRMNDMTTSKRLLPIAAALLLATSAIQGQAPQPQTQATPPPAPADTIVMTADPVQTASTDTTIIVHPVESRADDDKIGLFVDKESSRLKLRLDNGDIADIGELVSEGLDLAQKPAWMIVSILAIIICVPCLAAIIALILLFIFLRRRNRDRNELIAKGIDHDYHLPDSFYGRQNTVPVQPQEDKGDGDGLPQPQPVAVRNPRTFSNALTLIVVGLCIFLFFSITASVGVGFLLGGIPLFLGIGRMIGYYFVPGFDSSNGNKPKHGHMYPPVNPPYNNGYNNRPPYYNNNDYNNNGSFTPPAGNTPNGCPPPPPGYNR